MYIQTYVYLYKHMYACTYIYKYMCNTPSRSKVVRRQWTPPMR